MLHAKKSLGQNFLNSKAIARDIVRASELCTHMFDIRAIWDGKKEMPKIVLEIGPGKGFLTEELLRSGVRVIGVEKDDRMIPILSEKFAEEIATGQLTLVHDDVLVFIKKHTWRERYKVVANIPYYLTGIILRTFLEASVKPETMILMVQKEVALRIIARDKKESILSTAVKAYGIPRIVKKVSARYFTPAPKVDSAILAIENISNKNFSNKDTEKLFFKIVHAGFAHKRKKLVGNLKPSLGNEIVDIFEKLGINVNVRAEDITLDQWLKITKLRVP